MNFHNACGSQSQTLIICLNNYGKKIGGYSTQPWISYLCTIPDYTIRSFIFSLTNDDKFLMSKG